MTIPATAWAVFDCMLPELQDITKKIYSDWYQSTGYEHPGTPDLEVYLNEGPDEEMKCRIWAPVVKKE
jgi:AraC family transcriptional regulator